MTNCKCSMCGSSNHQTVACEKYKNKSIIAELKEWAKDNEEESNVVYLDNLLRKLEELEQR